VKKLFLDIETSPHLAYTWGLFNENIGLGQLVEPSRVLCVGYKFDGRPLQFAAEWQQGGHERMIEKVHAALCDADVVVHYNGQSFDEKHLNREFLMAELAPPSPFQRVDLYRTVKKRFKFASSRLEHVVRQLQIRDGKIKTDFSLWKRCLDGEKAAHCEMEKYNLEDVSLLVDLYDELLPWITAHPNVALGHDFACTKCGSKKLQRRGVYRTAAGVYQRFQCQDCGAWSRAATRSSTTALRPS
jgi:uncharacterized protein